MSIIKQQLDESPTIDASEHSESDSDLQHNLSPRMHERPIAYADRIGSWYANKLPDDQRKIHGYFCTPVQVADFMAKKIKAKKNHVRILDPAAGTGVLCCAAVETLVSRHPKPKSIEVVMYEIDKDLIPFLRMVSDYLVRWSREKHEMTVSVCIKARDFVLANADTVEINGLFRHYTEKQKFDVVIANPPYFKIGKSDPRAEAIPSVVHGQPNIYSLFMTVGAALLSPNGNFIYIIPRSFTSGKYFQRFRTVFFNMIRPVMVHVFGSRRETFRRESVLQENIILFGIRQDGWHIACNSSELSISSSVGVQDINSGDKRALPTRAALDIHSLDKVLRLPINDADDAALALVHSWPTSLHGLGLDVSTGPVVPFRATNLVCKDGKLPVSHSPLLWMNHVQAMRITWPLNQRKPEYIKRSGAEALLVSNRNYVLLRRFSAKEETRRITAAPWISTRSSNPDIGLENHLNYIHRPGGSLSKDEAWGLAALLNSQVLDNWFRTVNGNTQVSATELRGMPLPTRNTIIRLGRQVRSLEDPLIGLDTLVDRLMRTTKIEDALG